jgi:predicted small lipoprotein YifL
MMKKMFPIWILLIILAGGCGVKGALVPPDVLVAKAIKDLQGTVKEDTFELTWSVPKENVKGSGPADLVYFRVLRREETGGCPECPGEFKVRAELDLRTPKGYVLEKDTATWVDTDLKEGVIYMYKIIGVNHWGYASAPSNEVMIKWAAVPVPPAPPAPEPSGEQKE